MGEHRWGHHGNCGQTHLGAMFAAQTEPLWGPHGHAGWEWKHSEMIKSVESITELNSCVIKLKQDYFDVFFPCYFIL